MTERRPEVQGSGRPTFQFSNISAAFFLTFLVPITISLTVLAAITFRAGSQFAEQAMFFIIDASGKEQLVRKAVIRGIRPAAKHRCSQTINDERTPWSAQASEKFAAVWIKTNVAGLVVPGTR